MSRLTRWSLKNSVAVIILCIMVLAGGIVSTQNLKLQEFPDIEVQQLMIRAQYVGANAEDVEREVTLPIEESMKSIAGYNSISSTSMDHGAGIIITYPYEQDMTQTQTEVGDAIAKLDLPASAEIEISRPSFSDALFEAAITVEDNKRLQESIEKEVVPALKNIEGVSAVNISGIQTPELHIEVDRNKAQKAGISLTSVAEAVESLEYALPIGSVQHHEESIAIRLDGKLDSIAAIEQLTLPTDGQTIKLSDIASISKSSSKQEITRFNGKESFVIAIEKVQGANTADISKKVRQALDSYQEAGKLQYHVMEDQGKNAEESVMSLVREGIYGALFTIIIVFLFLRNIRATMIAALSLPLSILFTNMALDQMDYSLNMMTLSGLAVSIGRIVDDSIVVIENIFRWRVQRGKDMNIAELVLHATKEVIGAVASSTLVTVVVFLPLAFITGLIGEFFRPFAVTVSITILSSLLVAVAVIPLFGNLFLNQVKHREAKTGAITNWFERLLRASLRRKGVVLSASVLLLVGSFLTVPSLGFTFLPSGEKSAFTVNITLPAKTELAKTDTVAQEVENYLGTLPEVLNQQLYIGYSNDDESVDRGLAKYNEAHFLVRLKKGADIASVMDRANNNITQLVHRIEVDGKVNLQEEEDGGPPEGNNIVVDLYSSDLTALSQVAADVEAYLRQNSHLKNVSNNLKEVKPAWSLTLNETGQAVAEPEMIFSIIGEQLRPVDAGRYQIGGKDWDVSVSYNEVFTSKEELQGVQIPTAQGLKKLDEISNLSEIHAPAAINHNNGRISATLTADFKDKDISSASGKVEKGLSALTLPDNVEMAIGGGEEETEDAMIQMLLAMGAAIGLVFLVLSVTFRGIITPVVILGSLIFIPAGALSGLLIAGEPLSLSAMIGMLMLIGIVVTNAIVLLDRVEKNRMAGMNIDEALIEGAKTRMRPILMTALATIFALVPLALSTSSSEVISSGLAVTVIGGLTTSTLLTLVFVPVLYSILGKYRKYSSQ